MKLAIIFDNFGPYHLARVNALSSKCDVHAIELFETSTDYAWKTVKTSDFKLQTVYSMGVPNEATYSELCDMLDAIKPQIVFVPGWSSGGALASLLWALSAGVPAIVMSESQENDAPRFWSVELIKRWILSQFSGAIVGGSPHREYAEKLGMEPERIFDGYDTVDNSYFRYGAEEARRKSETIRSELGLPRPFFLASARFVEKKNLPMLLRAYSGYRKRFLEHSSEGSVWDLVLLGDGLGRAELQDILKRESLEKFVHLAGFRQYQELPNFFGLAECFVHCSKIEQWGLVVNEAMASGLPVLVSRNCGCARDLVEEEVNGFTFDPTNRVELENALIKMTSIAPVDRAKMGAASSSVISKWDPERFANSVMAVSRKVLSDDRKKVTFFERIIFSIMIKTRGRS
jgi:1,2-diacylglycerol 3-alpha-glucosyltransferase